VSLPLLRVEYIHKRNKVYKQLKKSKYSDTEILVLCYYFNILTDKGKFILMLNQVQRCGCFLGGQLDFSTCVREY
jgi:hypothetical protein